MTIHYLAVKPALNEFQAGVGDRHALHSTTLRWHGHGADSKDLAVLIDGAGDLASADFGDCSWPCSARRHGERMSSSTWTVSHTPDRFAVFLLDVAEPESFAEPAATDPDVEVAVTDGRLTTTLRGPDWSAQRL